MRSFRFLDEKNVRLEEDIDRLLREKGKRKGVHAVVQDGRVTLVGWVDSSEEKKELEGWVGTCPGVRTVTNHLHIKPSAERVEEPHF